MKICADCIISLVITTCVSCEAPLTSPGHGFSHMSCKNKRFCLEAIHVGGRRGVRSIGSPPLPALEKAPGGGGGDGFQQPQESLCSFVGSSYTQQPSVCISEPRLAHLRDLWVPPRVLASGYREVRRASRFPKEMKKPPFHCAAESTSQMNKGHEIGCFSSSKWNSGKTYLPPSLRKEHRNAQRLISEQGDVLFKGHAKQGWETRWAV